MFWYFVNLLFTCNSVSSMSICCISGSTWNSYQIQIPCIYDFNQQHSTNNQNASFRNIILSYLRFYLKYIKDFANRPMSNKSDNIHRNEPSKRLLICNAVRKCSAIRFTNQRAAFCPAALVTAKTFVFEFTNHDRRFRHLNSGVHPLTIFTCCAQTIVDCLRKDARNLCVNKNALFLVTILLCFEERICGKIKYKVWFVFPPDWLS